MLVVWNISISSLWSSTFVSLLFLLTVATALCLTSLRQLYGQPCLPLLTHTGCIDICLSIRGFPHLEILNLSENKFTGSIPSEMFRLTNLSKLGSLVLPAAWVRIWTRTFYLSCEIPSRATHILCISWFFRCIPSTELLDIGRLPVESLDLTGTIPTDIVLMTNLGASRLLKLPRCLCVCPLPYSQIGTVMPLCCVVVCTRPLAESNCIPEYLSTSNVPIRGRFPTELSGLSKLSEYHSMPAPSRSV